MTTNELRPLGLTISKFDVCTILDPLLDLCVGYRLVTPCFRASRSNGEHLRISSRH